MKLRQNAAGHMIMKEEFIMDFVDDAFWLLKKVLK